MSLANTQRFSPALASKLAKLGIMRSCDLLLHLPLRYEDETHVRRIADAPWDAAVLVEAKVCDVTVQFSPRRQLQVVVDDESGQLILRFLNFYANQIKLFESARAGGQSIRIFGEIRQGYFGAEMIHPRCHAVRADEALPASLTPVYPTTAGLGQATLRKTIAIALKTAETTEFLDPHWCVQHKLMTFAQAVHFLHAPPPDVFAPSLENRTHPAWQRIKFDEVLAQQLSLRRAYLARRQKGAPRLEACGHLAERLRHVLPFSLTVAQERVLAEITHDLCAAHPMQRLLQGDVGSGKTIVAALAACHAIEAGYQAALMAPTEILAEQHFVKLSAWLNPLGLQIVWLSGSLKTAAKKRAQQDVATAHLIIGTHALIQEGVDFNRLGLTIIDEQHRFGVAQRLTLKQKGTNPHQLMMSATPIPRTLAMSYYADLDVSVIDALPPGRRPIRTKLIADTRRDELISRLRAWVSNGSQAYWVCPLIEESEKLQLKTAIDTHANLSEELPDLVIGLVHGRLKADEKAAVMAAFVRGETHILVATTVIEVGVDVPNASLMVIEHAERFGLSQLHQLRGRIGRGALDSVCILLYQTPLSATARARLKVIYENTDGFEIARQDLALRGPGEFIGSRQSGVPLLRYADLEQDLELVDLARGLADQLLRESPQCVNAHLQRWLGQREELLRA